MRRSPRLTVGLALMLCALASAATTSPAHARSSTMYAAPDFCQVIEDTGQLITIGWASQGCSAEREAMRERVAVRSKFPGRYPPLTCVADGKRYPWDSLSCTHARNRYAAGAIRPVYFGRPPSRRTAAPSPTMMPAPSVSPAASASPSPVPKHARVL